MIAKKPFKETQTHTRQKTIKPERSKVVDGVKIVTPCVVKEVEIEAVFWVVETEINGEIERHRFKIKKAATSFLSGGK
ncbi:MAG: hypothetical protein COA45_03970 [Zetaproteobacteria bacterium]|nr:MAG: hypothetical protein COA45_03970 [Zetaproteobacteria bacterium]